MNRWIGAAYGSVGHTAELVAALMPQGVGGKVGRTFSSRRGLRRRYEEWGRKTRDRSRPLLWMHAASVGEAMMALPVLQRVRRSMPLVQTAFTFFSPSAELFAHQMGVDFSDYLAFDTASSARTALAALDPTAIVFSKGDVWPALVREAAAQDVRLGIVSASMPSGSMRASRIGALLTRDAYGSLDAIGAASSADAESLVRAGAREGRVRVTGDTRYDQAWSRAHTGARNTALVGGLRVPRPTLVAGSTWPSDERHLLSAWRTVRANLPTARIVIAPHELTPPHLASLERWARDESLSCAGLDAAGPETDVVLVDRMGVLAELYDLATVAYVGGGFQDAGLHSLVEPAVFGIPVLIGPNSARSRDAQLMLRSGGAITAHDAGELSRLAQRLMSDSRERADRSEAIGAVVAAELGAADRSFEIVRELLRTV